MRVPRHSLIADNEETDRLVHQGFGSTIAVLQIKLMWGGHDSAFCMSSSDLRRKYLGIVFSSEESVHSLPLEGVLRFVNAACRKR